MTEESKTMTRIIPAIAIILALAMFANGAAMLVNPLGWYGRVPGVVETGPFNQHFIRDIGLVYALTGLAFAAGAFRAHLRVALWGAASVWLTGHAAFHFWEVAVWICGPDAIPRDFAGVTLPALVAIALSLWALGKKS